MNQSFETTRELFTRVILGLAVHADAIVAQTRQSDLVISMLERLLERLSQRAGQDFVFLRDVPAEDASFILEILSQVAVGVVSGACESYEESAKQGNAEAFSASGAALTDLTIPSAQAMLELLSSLLQAVQNPSAKFVNAGMQLFAVLTGVSVGSLSGFSLQPRQMEQEGLDQLLRSVPESFMSWLPMSRQEKVSLMGPTHATSVDSMEDDMHDLDASMGNLLALRSDLAALADVLNAVALGLGDEPKPVGGMRSSAAGETILESYLFDGGLANHPALKRMRELSCTLDLPSQLMETLAEAAPSQRHYNPSLRSAYREVPQPGTSGEMKHRSQKSSDAWGVATTTPRADSLPWIVTSLDEAFAQSAGIEYLRISVASLCLVGRLANLDAQFSVRPGSLLAAIESSTTAFRRAHRAYVQLANSRFATSSANVSGGEHGYLLSPEDSPVCMHDLPELFLGLPHLMAAAFSDRGDRGSATFLLRSYLGSMVLAEISGAREPRTRNQASDAFWFLLPEAIVKQACEHLRLLSRDALKQQDHESARSNASLLLVPSDGGSAAAEKLVFPRAPREQKLRLRHSKCDQLLWYRRSHLPEDAVADFLVDTASALFVCSMRKRQARGASAVTSPGYSAATHKAKKRRQLGPSRSVMAEVSFNHIESLLESVVRILRWNPSNASGAAPGPSASASSAAPEEGAAKRRRRSGRIRTSSNALQLPSSGLGDGVPSGAPGQGQSMPRGIKRPVPAGTRGSVSALPSPVLPGSVRAFEEQDSSEVRDPLFLSHRGVQRLYEFWPSLLEDTTLELMDRAPGSAMEAWDHAVPSQIWTSFNKVVDVVVKQHGKAVRKCLEEVYHQSVVDEATASHRAGQLSSRTKLLWLLSTPFHTAVFAKVLLYGSSEMVRTARALLCRKFAAAVKLLSRSSAGEDKALASSREHGYEGQHDPAEQDPAEQDMLSMSQLEEITRYTALQPVYVAVLRNAFSRDHDAFDFPILRADDAASHPSIAPFAVTAAGQAAPGGAGFPADPKNRWSTLQHLYEGFAKILSRFSLVLWSAPGQRQQLAFVNSPGEEQPSAWPLGALLFCVRMAGLLQQVWADTCPDGPSHAQMMSLQLQQLADLWNAFDGSIMGNAPLMLGQADFAEGHNRIARDWRIPHVGDGPSKTVCQSLREHLASLLAFQLQCCGRQRDAFARDVKDRSHGSQARRALLSREGTTVLQLLCLCEHRIQRSVHGLSASAGEATPELQAALGSSARDPGRDASSTAGREGARPPEGTSDLALLRESLLLCVWALGRLHGRLRSGFGPDVLGSALVSLPSMLGFAQGEDEDDDGIHDMVAEDSGTESNPAGPFEADAEPVEMLVASARAAMSRGLCLLKMLSLDGADPQQRRRSNPVEGAGPWRKRKSGRARRSWLLQVLTAALDSCYMVLSRSLWALKQNVADAVSSELMRRGDDIAMLADFLHASSCFYRLLAAQYVRALVEQQEGTAEGQRRLASPVDASVSDGASPGSRENDRTLLMRAMLGILASATNDREALRRLLYASGEAAEQSLEEREASQGSRQGRHFDLSIVADLSTVTHAEFLTPVEAQIMYNERGQRSSIESEESAMQAAASSLPEVQFDYAALNGLLSSMREVFAVDSAAASCAAPGSGSHADMASRCLRLGKLAFTRLMRATQVYSTLRGDEELLPVRKVLAEIEVDYQFSYVHDICEVISEDFGSMYFTMVDAYQLQKSISSFSFVCSHRADEAPQLGDEDHVLLAHMEALREHAIQHLLRILRSSSAINAELSDGGDVASEVLLAPEGYVLAAQESGFSFREHLVVCLGDTILDDSGAVNEASLAAALSLLLRVSEGKLRDVDVASMRKCVARADPLRIWNLCSRAQTYRFGDRIEAFFARLVTEGPEGLEPAFARVLERTLDEALATVDEWPVMELRGTSRALSILYRFAFATNTVDRVVEYLILWCRGRLSGTVQSRADALSLLRGLVFLAGEIQGKATPANPVCTYSKTGEDYQKQHWFHCYSCELSMDKGCCEACLLRCHRDHDVSYGRYSNFFCDCGAGSACHGTFACECSSTSHVDTSGGDADGEALEASKLQSGDESDRWRSSIGEAFAKSGLLDVLSSAMQAINERTSAGRSSASPPADQGTELLDEMEASFDGHHLSMETELCFPPGSVSVENRGGSGSHSERARLLVVQGMVRGRRASHCPSGKHLVTIGSKRLHVYALGLGLASPRASRSEVRLVGDDAYNDRLQLATSRQPVVPAEVFFPLEKRSLDFHPVAVHVNGANDSFIALYGPYRVEIYQFTDGVIGDKACALTLDGAEEGSCYIKRVQWLGGTSDALLVVSNRWVRVATLFPERTVTLVDESQGRHIGDGVEIDSDFFGGARHDAARGTDSEEKDDRKAFADERELSDTFVAVLFEDASLGVYSLALQGPIHHFAGAEDMLEAVLPDCSTLTYVQAQRALLVTSAALPPAFLYLKGHSSSGGAKLSLGVKRLFDEAHSDIMQPRVLGDIVPVGGGDPPGRRAHEGAVEERMGEQMLFLQVFTVGLEGERHDAVVALVFGVRDPAVEEVPSHPKLLKLEKSPSARESEETLVIGSSHRAPRHQETHPVDVVVHRVDPSDRAVGEGVGKASSAEEGSAATPTTFFVLFSDGSCEAYRHSSATPRDREEDALREARLCAAGEEKRDLPKGSQRSRFARPYPSTFLLAFYRRARLIPLAKCRIDAEGFDATPEQMKDRLLRGKDGTGSDGGVAAKSSAGGVMFLRCPVAHIVGVRVLLGSSSPDEHRTPEYVQVGEQCVRTTFGVRRWYDFILSYEEAQRVRDMGGVLLKVSPIHDTTFEVDLRAQSQGERMYSDAGAPQPGTPQIECLEIMGVPSIDVLLEADSLMKDAASCANKSSQELLKMLQIGSQALEILQASSAGDDQSGALDGMRSALIGFVPVVYGQVGCASLASVGPQILSMVRCLGLEDRFTGLVHASVSDRIDRFLTGWAAASPDFRSLNEFLRSFVCLLTSHGWETSLGDGPARRSPAPSAPLTRSRAAANAQPEKRSIFERLCVTLQHCLRGHSPAVLRNRTHVDDLGFLMLKLFLFECMCIFKHASKESTAEPNRVPAIESALSDLCLPLVRIAARLFAVFGESAEWACLLAESVELHLRSPSSATEASPTASTGRSVNAPARSVASASGFAPAAGAPAAEEAQRSASADGMEESKDYESKHWLEGNAWRSLLCLLLPSERGLLLVSLRRAALVHMRECAAHALTIETYAPVEIHKQLLWSRAAIACASMAVRRAALSLQSSASLNPAYGSSEACPVKPDDVVATCDVAVKLLRSRPLSVLGLPSAGLQAEVSSTQGLLSNFASPLLAILLVCLRVLESLLAETRKRDASRDKEDGAKSDAEALHPRSELAELIQQHLHLGIESAGRSDANAIKAEVRSRSPCLLIDLLERVSDDENDLSAACVLQRDVEGQFIPRTVMAHKDDPLWAVLSWLKPTSQEVSQPHKSSASRMPSTARVPGPSALKWSQRVIAATSAPFGPDGRKAGSSDNPASEPPSEKATEAIPPSGSQRLLSELSRGPRSALFFTVLSFYEAVADCRLSGRSSHRKGAAPGEAETAAEKASLPSHFQDDEVLVRLLPSSAWLHLMCEVISKREWKEIRACAKRVLRRVCGSRTTYYRIRDLYCYTAHLKGVHSVLRGEDIRGSSTIRLDYMQKCELKRHLEALLKSIAGRKLNWALTAMTPFSISRDTIRERPFSFVLSSDAGGEQMDLDQRGASWEDMPPALLLWHLALKLPPQNREGALKLLALSIPSIMESIQASRRGSTKASMAVALLEAVRKDGLLTSSRMSFYIDALLLGQQEEELREAAEAVLDSVFPFLDTDTQVGIWDSLLERIPRIAIYGQRAGAFLKILGMLQKQKGLLRSRRDGSPQDPSVVVRVLMEALGRCYENILNHPNAAIYNVTDALLDEPAHYLEHMPCAVCHPEMQESQHPGRPRDGSSAKPSSKAASGSSSAGSRASRQSATSRSDSSADASRKAAQPAMQMRAIANLRTASKNTEDSTAVRLRERLCIRQIHMRLTDASHLRATTVQVYHNDDTAVSLADLKVPENWHRWKLAGLLRLSSSQTTCSLALPLPLYARYLLFRYTDVASVRGPSGSARGPQPSSTSARHPVHVARHRHWGTSDGAMQSSSPTAGMICPRCESPVGPNQTICRHCGEMAMQCRNCRAINYANPGAFLCSECGYCAHGTYSFSLLCDTAPADFVLRTQSDRRTATLELEGRSLAVDDARTQLASLRPLLLQAATEAGGAGALSYVPANAETPDSRTVEGLRQTLRGRLGTANLPTPRTSDGTKLSEAQRQSGGKTLGEGLRRRGAVTCSFSSSRKAPSVPVAIAPLPEPSLDASARVSLRETVRRLEASSASSASATTAATAASGQSARPVRLRAERGRPGGDSAAASGRSTSSHIGRDLVDRLRRTRERIRTARPAGASSRGSGHAAARNTPVEYLASREQVEADLLQMGVPVLAASARNPQERTESSRDERSQETPGSDVVRTGGISTPDEVLPQQAASTAEQFPAQVLVPLNARPAEAAEQPEVDRDSSDEGSGDEMVLAEEEDGHLPSQRGRQSSGEEESGTGRSEAMDLHGSRTPIDVLLLSELDAITDESDAPSHQGTREERSSGQGLASSSSGSRSRSRAKRHAAVVLREMLGANWQDTIDSIRSAGELDALRPLLLRAMRVSRRSGSPTPDDAPEATDVYEGTFSRGSLRRPARSEAFAGWQPELVGTMTGTQYSSFSGREDPFEASDTPGDSHEDALGDLVHPFAEESATSDLPETTSTYDGPNLEALLEQDSSDAGDVQMDNAERSTRAHASALRTSSRRHLSPLLPRETSASSSARYRDIVAESKASRDGTADLNLKEVPVGRGASSSRYSAGPRAAATEDPARDGAGEDKPAMLSQTARSAGAGLGKLALNSPVLRLHDLYVNRAKAAFEKLLASSREMQALQARVLEYDAERQLSFQSSDHGPHGSYPSQDVPCEVMISRALLESSSISSCYACAINGAVLIHEMILQLLSGMDDEKTSHEGLCDGSLCKRLLVQLLQVTARTGSKRLRNTACCLICEILRQQPDSISSVVGPLVTKVDFVVRNQSRVNVSAVLGHDVLVVRRLCEMLTRGVDVEAGVMRVKPEASDDDFLEMASLHGLVIPSLLRTLLHVLRLAASAAASSEPVTSWVVMPFLAELRKIGKRLRGSASADNASDDALFWVSVHGRILLDNDHSRSGPVPHHNVERLASKPAFSFHSALLNEFLQFASIPSERPAGDAGIPSWTSSVMLRRRIALALLQKGGKPNSAADADARKKKAEKERSSFSWDRELSNTTSKTSRFLASFLLNPYSEELREEAAVFLWEAIKDTGDGGSSRTMPRFVDCLFSLLSECLAARSSQQGTASWASEAQKEVEAEAEAEAELRLPAKSNPTQLCRLILHALKESPSLRGFILGRGGLTFMTNVVRVLTLSLQQWEQLRAPLLARRAADAPVPGLSIDPAVISSVLLTCCQCLQLLWRFNREATVRAEGSTPLRALLPVVLALDSVGALRNHSLAKAIAVLERLTMLAAASPPSRAARRSRYDGLGSLAARASLNAFEAEGSMSGSTRLISLSQSSQRSYAILPRVPVDVMQELEGDSDGDGDSEGERPSRFEHRSVALSLEPLDTLRNPWSFRRLMRGGASAASSADGDNERLNSSSRRLSLSAGAVDDALPLPSCSDDDPSARRRCQDFLGASMSALRSCVDPTPHCPFLSIDSIESLLSRVRNILDPARPLPTFKIKMIRARTQEEFFRGHLRSNPIPFQDLVRVVKAWEATSFDSSVDRGAESPSAGALAEQQAASVSRTSLPDLGPGCSVDPTVADLKRYIAVTLEMPDSAELLELLCCGKILDGALPVRLVWEHVWKPYVSDSKPDGVYIPPMSVTYRLAGVDGEATEEQLSTIADASASPDKPLSERYAITSIFGRPAPLPVSTMPAAEPDAPGLHWLLHAFLAASDLAAAGGIVGELPCKVAEHSLAVLRMACCVPENAALLHKLGAPGRLLEQLLSLLRHSAPSTGSLARTRLLTSEGAERHRLVDPLTHMIAELMSTSESSESSGNLGPMGAGDASLLMAEAAASQKEEEDAAAGKRDHSDAYKQINFLVTSLRETVIEEELKSKPRLRVAVSRLLPALTCGEGDAVELLAAAAADAIRWDARSSRGAHGERQAEAMELESKTEDVVHESKDEDDSESSAASEAYALPASSQCIFDALSGYLTSSALCGKIRRAVALTDLLPRTVRAVLMDAPSLPVPTAAAFAIYKRDRHQGRAPKPVHMPSKEDCTRAWSTFAGKRTLLPCLKLLQGLCSAHPVAVDTILELPEGEGGRLLSLLHALEQANCVDAAGLAAENLLRAMRAVSVLAAASIEQIQTRTNEEKQRLASKRKKRALEAISRSPPEERAASSSQKARRKPAKKGRKPARAPKPSPKPSSWLQQAENLAEESGLACMICHEGYGLQPSSLLGVYGYMQPFTADRGAVEGAKLLLGGPEKAFEAGSVTKLKFCGTWTSIRPMSDTSVPMASTVTAFRPIHQQCHAAASDAAANSKTSRSEWESATMRNSRMRTNVVIPLYSPTVRAMDFRRALERYRSMAEGQCGMDSTGVLATVLHDARILSLRMAHRLDICKDAGGGSDVTNIALLPALLGIGSFVFWNVLTFCRKNDAPRGIGRGPRETIDFRSPMLADITDAARYAAIAHRFFSAAASKLPEPSPEVQEGVGGLLTTLRSVGSFQEVGESSAGEGSLPLLAGAAPFVCVLALVLVGKKDWHAARTLLLRELLRHAKLHPVEEERVSLIPATKASAREMRVALPGLSRSGRKRARSSAEPEPAPKDDGQQLPAWLSDILPGCSLQRSLPMLRFCALLFAVHDAMHAEATEENPEALYQLPSVASTVDEAATARVKSRIEAVESAASVGDAVDLLLAAD